MTDLEKRLDERLLEVALEWELSGIRARPLVVRRKELPAEHHAGPPATRARLALAAAALLLLAAGVALWQAGSGPGWQGFPADFECLEVADMDAALERGREFSRPVVCFLHAGDETGGGPRHLEARVREALTPLRGELEPNAGLILTHLDVAGRPEAGEYYGLARPDGAVLFLEPYIYPDKRGNEHESAIIGRLQAGDRGLGSFLLAGIHAWRDRLGCRAAIDAAWQTLRAADQAAFEEQLWPPLIERQGPKDVARMYRSLVRWARLSDRYVITSFTAAPLPREISSADQTATGMFRAHVAVSVDRQGVTVGTLVDIVKRVTADGDTFQTIWNE